MIELFYLVINLSHSFNPLLQYIYNYIKTPLFVVNSQYDSIILESTYLLPCIPPNCNVRGNDLLKEYKQEFDRQVEPLLSSPQQNGYFLDSCYIHCQTIEDDVAWTQIGINGHTMVEAFGDWYFERSMEIRLKDCDEFPCNPTCPNLGSGTIKHNDTSTHYRFPNLDVSPHNSTKKYF